MLRNVCAYLNDTFCRPQEVDAFDGKMWNLMKDGPFMVPILVVKVELIHKVPNTKDNACIWEF